MVTNFPSIIRAVGVHPACFSLADKSQRLLLSTSKPDCMWNPRWSNVRSNESLMLNKPFFSGFRINITVLPPPAHKCLEDHNQKYSIFLLYSILKCCQTEWRRTLVNFPSLPPCALCNCSLSDHPMSFWSLPAADWYHWSKSLKSNRHMQPQIQVQSALTGPQGFCF